MDYLKKPSAILSLIFNPHEGHVDCLEEAKPPNLWSFSCTHLSLIKPHVLIFAVGTDEHIYPAIGANDLHRRDKNTGRYFITETSLLKKLQQLTSKMEDLRVGKGENCRENYEPLHPRRLIFLKGTFL